MSTWTIMSNVRAHAEDLFIMFLPESMRDAVRHQFTPGVASLTEFAMIGDGYPSRLSDLDPSHPLEDLTSRVRDYMGDEIVEPDALNPDPLKGRKAPDSIESVKDIEAALYQLTKTRGGYTDALPDITWVRVDRGGDEPLAYTVLANRIYYSNSRLIAQSFPKVNRHPELDSISVLRGFVGAYPELFLDIPLAELGDAIKAGGEGTKARKKVRAKYEVARNTPAFWKFLDGAHARLLKDAPLDSAIVDTSGYLWPAKLQDQKEPLEE